MRNIVVPTHIRDKSVRFNISDVEKCSYSRRNVSRLLMTMEENFTRVAYCRCREIAELCMFLLSPYSVIRDSEECAHLYFSLIGRVGSRENLYIFTKFAKSSPAKFACGFFCAFYSILLKRTYYSFIIFILF